MNRRRVAPVALFLVLALALGSALAAPAAPARRAPAKRAAPAARAPEVAWLPAPMTEAERESLIKAYLADRKETTESMRTSPQSSLAAIARVDFGREPRWLLVGSAPECALRLDDPSVRPQHVRVRVEGEGFRVEALDPGATFTAYGAGGRDTTAATLPPSWIGVGRYRVRLSYQNSPALIACDPDVPTRAAWTGNTWWPPHLGLRFLVALEPDVARDTVRIESTNGPPRPSVRAGWFHFVVGGKKQRLAAVRLLEPGVGPDDLSVFFRDGTSGQGSYGMGRYVDPVRQPDGRWLLDFNLAYNPACAFSPYYNCPVPPAENTLSVRIPAGEKDPHAAEPAAPAVDDHAGHRH